MRQDLRDLQILIDTKGVDGGADGARKIVCILILKILESNRSPVDLVENLTENLLGGVFILCSLRVIQGGGLCGYFDKCAVILVRFYQFDESEALGDNVKLEVVALLLRGEFGLFFVLVAWAEHSHAFNYFGRRIGLLFTDYLDMIGISLDSLVRTKIAFHRSGLRLLFLILIVLDGLFHALDYRVLQLEPIFGRKLLVQVRHLEHRSLHIDEVDISKRLGRRPSPRFALTH